MLTSIKQLTKGERMEDLIFTKLDKHNIPEPNTLVWVKRINGPMYLGTRVNAVLSTAIKEPWSYCFWYGYQYEMGKFITEDHDLKNNTNFSDVTVESWAYVEMPNL